MYRVIVIITNKRKVGRSNALKRYTKVGYQKLKRQKSYFIL